MSREWREAFDYTHGFTGAESGQDLKNLLVSQTATGWFEEEVFGEGTLTQQYNVRGRIITMTLEGRFDGDRLLEGRKTLNGKLVQESHYDILGKLVMINFENDGQPSRKTFFDKNETWLKTEYYEAGKLVRTKEYDAEQNITLFKRFNPENGRLLSSGFLVCGREIPMSETKKLLRNAQRGVISEIHDMDGSLVYVGECSGLLPHGNGRLFHGNNFLEYEGEFRQGKRHGPGRSYYMSPAPGGQSMPRLLYEGYFENDRYSGNGTLYDQERADGSKLYEGEWKDGEILSGEEYCGPVVVYSGPFKGEDAEGRFIHHGQGVQRHSNGQLQFEGRFTNGLFDSPGTVYNENGPVFYTGDIIRGMPGERGVLTLADGSRIEQQSDIPNRSDDADRSTVIKHYDAGGRLCYIGGAIFQAPAPDRDFAAIHGYLRQGSGITYYENGERFEGVYDGDLRNGPGIYYFDNNQIKSQGTYKDDVFDGECAEFDRDGNFICRGIFESGKCVDGGGTFVLKSGEIYVGAIKARRRVGHAVIYYPDGRMKYEGEFADNFFDGPGVYYYENGNVQYNGTYAAGKYNDDGILYNEDGSVAYRGSWLAGLKSGEGVLNYPDGSRYVGAFSNDLRHATGKQYGTDGGLIYEGAFDSDRMEGAGKSFDREGRLIYDGQWKNGVYCGEGCLHFENGGVHFAGTFENGVLHGTGREYDAQGVLLYEGSWANGVREGRGSIYYRNGDRYDGDIKAGSKQGTGKYYYADGKLAYEGEYADNRRGGQGTAYDKAGAVFYVGGFKDGKRDGYGRQYGPGGILLYDGEFSADLYHGKGKYCSPAGVLLYEGGFSGGKREGSGVHYFERTGLRDYEGGYKNDLRHGYGTSYAADGETRVYAGFWADGLYEGPGVLYDAGNKPVFAGEFSGGSMHGRINELVDGRIVAETVYDHGHKVYARVYDDVDIFVYEGEMKDGVCDGWGKSYTDTGERAFEGLFQNGAPCEPGAFTPRGLQPLPECADFAEPDYESFRVKRTFEVVGQRMPDGSSYYGRLQDGAPVGRGRMIWPDGKKYAGDFTDGKPTGSGVLTWEGYEYTGPVNDGFAHGRGVLKTADGSVYEGEFANMKRTGTFRIANPIGIILEADFADDIQQTVPKVITPAELSESERAGTVPEAAVSLPAIQNEQLASV